MIDIFQVMTSGGLVLFRKEYAPETEILKRRISISKFIQHKFLAGKLQSEEKQYVLENNCYLYRHDHDNDLIYVLVCPREHYAPVFDQFFFKCANTFAKGFYDAEEKKRFGCLVRPRQDFENIFERIFQSTDFSGQGLAVADSQALNASENGQSEGSKKKKRRRKKKKKKKVEGEEGEIDETKSSRKWDPLMYSGRNKVTKKMREDLNFSQGEYSESDKIQNAKNQFFENDSDSEFSVVLSEEEQEASFGSFSLFGKLKSSLKSFNQGSQITSEMLEPILDKFKTELITKNVAEVIASKVVKNLETKLLNEKKGFFTSLGTIVRNSLQESLREILTPKNHIDIVAEALKSKEEGRPYVCVFIGVNGVGKSTNLAKVAYLLKTSGFSVMLAACDNFRAGAVEQLKTHGACLEVPVFDKGYKDDPANIAREALMEAAAKKIGKYVLNQIQYCSNQMKQIVIPAF